MPGYRFCVASNLYASHPVEVALDRIATTGTTFVDLWSCPPIADHVSPERHRASAVRRMLSDSGLRLGPLSIYLTTPEQRRRRMEYAAELGADSVIFEPGPLANFHEKMSNMDLRGRTLGQTGDTWEQFVDTLIPYLRLAEELGLKLALEVPHLYTHIETPAAVERLNQAVDSRALAYTLAPTHTLARRNTIDAAVRACGKRLWVFYLWDVKPGYDPQLGERAFGDGEQQLPGLGSLDWRAVGHVLESAGFTGYCDVKCHSTEKWTDLGQLDDAIGRSVRHVRPLLDL